MPPRLPFVIGILAWCFVECCYARASTRVRVPVPTSETIPYVAEVMGAASYEESVEEGSGEVKRVQRKLADRKEQDLDQDDQFAEYQGVIGRPGVDFPVLPGIPRTDFNCKKVKSSGYYADLETGCQVFHICDGGRKISFLCPNGTIFRQSHLICDWWFRVDCERSVEQYEESAEQLAHDQMIYKKRAEQIAKAMTAKLVATENPQKSLTSVSYNQRQPVQQQSRRKPRPQQNYEQVEDEKQVPAETASFVSNKHRFGNQLLESQYRQFLATSTNTPPSSYSTSFDYNTQQYQNTQGPSQQNNYQNNKQKTYDNTQTYDISQTYNNNLPNKANYQVSVQTSFSTSTTHGTNLPTSNNYPTSNENTNYQSTTSRNEPLFNSTTNYYNQNSNSPSNNRNNPSRGSVNYFNSNVGNENGQRITDSPTDSFSTDNGNIYSSTSQNYVDSSNSEAQALPLQGQSTVNDYIPHASTTVRSVTNRIASYNDHTPRSEKYTGIKQKAVFNVKIKPTKDTKDIAYVELLRQEEKDLHKITPETPTYSSPSSSSHEGSHYTIPVSQLVTTPHPTTVTESKSRNTYLPSIKQTSAKEITAKINPVTNRYASINVSGTSEEIRPEIVNALMENGVTPTSAKALHSLASYISSGAAEEDYSNVYDDGSHPHVSDVILNFHSGNPLTSGTEGTTNTPLTSSGEALPSVLTKATKESYSYLFSDSREQVDYKNEESKLDIETSSSKPRVATSSSQPQTTSNKQETKEDLKLKDSSELRELAQVFSRALSAYLEDPETFKEILAQVRPTEPNADNTTPSNEDEVLDFSDAMLGRLGTTLPPVTSQGNTDYVDDNLSIGEINSLASGKAYEQDNSLEHNTFPPTAPEALQDSQYTSASPKLLYFNAKNNSQTNNYYSKLGSADDQSYFPTVGGVSDTSRPRYGGFQNNTNKISKPYSPYGSEIQKNITGAPISTPRPPTSPQAKSFTKRFNVSSSTQNIPEPHDVNSLVKSNVLNADHASGEESFDTYQTSPSFLQEESYYSSGDQEKVLVASGSQSLVSSNNYVQFAKKFNEQQQQQSQGGKKQERFYKTNQQGRPAPSLVPIPVNAHEDLTPYFGQEPPLENLARPSGFKAQNSKSAEGRNKNKGKVANADPINYHIGNDNIATPAPLVSSSLSYEVTYGSTSLGSTSQEVWGSSPSGQSSWTVSPIFDVTSAGTSVNFNYTQKPASPPAHNSSRRYQPTTYHPPHSSESLEVNDAQWETTFQTENSPLDDTTPAYDTIGAATTLSSEDQYKTFAKAAKEMFGMLNETAAITLMNMMVQGESNMTIRRLVLLLVNEKGKDNITAQESRESLINALLTNKMATVPERPTVQSTTPTPRKKVRVSRVRVSTPSPQRSGKSYRGTDSMTGVHGSVPSPSDLNKINSAKLYIPSPSAAALTSGKLPLDSDARAVELLKTLYSLAAKWG